MPTYIVHSTDRSRSRTITAERPADAVGTFLGRRCATYKLSCWTADGREWIFDAAVRVGDGPFRWGQDAIRNVSVFVESLNA